MTADDVAGVGATGDGVVVVGCVLVLTVGGDPGEEVGEGCAFWEGGVGG